MEDKGYKTCVELKNITPQMIEEWNREMIIGEIKLVRRQTYLCCPLTDTLVSEKECQKCPHHYGDASTREIYCLPDVKRVKSVRTRRKAPGIKTKEEEKAMVARGEYITVERP